jgi:hypothetical protein
MPPLNFSLYHVGPNCKNSFGLGDPCFLDNLFFVDGDGDCVIYQDFCNNYFNNGPYYTFRLNSNWEHMVCEIKNKNFHRLNFLKKIR